MSKAYEKKVNAISKVLALLKIKSLMNFFFAAQSNYYPLVWMIHSRFNYRKHVFGDIQR